MLYVRMEVFHKKIPFIIHMKKSPETLVGHTAPVTGLAMRKHKNELLSAGEDGIIHSFDVSTLQEKSKTATSNPIYSLCASEKNIYYSSGSVLYHLDTRSSAFSQKIFEAREEINCIDLHQSEEFISLCEDSGDVFVIDVRSKRPFKKPRERHSNVASVCKFLPINKRWNLFSGGMDEMLFQWDFSRGSVISRHQFSSDVNSSTRFVNPSHVHSIAINPNDNMAAVGLGNGTVKLFTPQKNSKLIEEHKVDTIKAHSWSVTALEFSTQGTLISAGIDKKVVFNDVSTKTSKNFELERKPNCISILAHDNLTLAVGGTASEKNNFNIDIYSADFIENN